MKKLFINGKVINVLNNEISIKDVLLEDDKIIGVGDYKNYNSDEVIDVSGKYICPGFVDSHIHIESTMMTPYEFSRATLIHGTTAVVCDPHEIANVCGVDGIKYMIEASEGLPQDFYIMLPSCVPATCFDESYENIDAEKLRPLFNYKRVMGLAEMMNYPGVLFKDKEVLAKLNLAKELNKLIDGHAPMLTGSKLDEYISNGITSEHECTSYKEAMERLEKGQWLICRNGTAAKSLLDYIDVFDGDTSKCLLCTDDKEPDDIIKKGHIDFIIHRLCKKGKDFFKAIQAASINAYHRLGITDRGAIAPGFYADILVLDEIGENIKVSDVYKDGKLVVKNREILKINKPVVSIDLENKVRATVNCNKLKEEDFYVKPIGSICNVIEAKSYALITDKLEMELDFSKNNGISIEEDVLKLAVIERHRNSGNIGLGFIKGIGLKQGAIASTVSHDSHNIIVIGTNNFDMMIAANRIKEIGGGNVVVLNGKVERELKLPIAGLMSEKDCYELSKECLEAREYVHKLGVPDNIAPFMNMAFVSLDVIPTLKLTTKGYVDVNEFKIIPLFVDKK